MFKQASVNEIRAGQIRRPEHYVAVCMAHYPRGLKKELMDEYRVNLAPDRQLFSEWKDFEEKFGHEEAFVRSNYENRFIISPQGFESLRRLLDVSHKKDVYLVCQCEVGERCHREMVLLAAQHVLAAKIGPIHKSYPDFESRLKANRIQG